MADTPSFDRPGIAFSTGTVAPGSLSWEQGLPDYSRTRADDEHDYSYSTDTLLRTGLAKNIELQLGTSPFNEQISKSTNTRDTVHGFGDSTVGVKAALPLASARFSSAVLGNVSFPTGKKGISSDAHEYNLGAAGSWAVSDKESFGLYADIDRLEGRNSYVFSPSAGLALSDSIGAFVEAGFTQQAHAPNDAVAGGGLTWMATHAVQLDISADYGLTHRSTELQAGLGVSVFFN
jgi:hypothetical protein